MGFDKPRRRFFNIAYFSTLSLILLILLIGLLQEAGQPSGDNSSGLLIVFLYAGKRGSSCGRFGDSL